MEDQLYPDFILFVTGSQCRRAKVKIPKKWITDYEDKVPKGVKIELPNGAKYNGRFEKNDRSIYDIEDLLLHFGNPDGIYMIFGYSGEGKFDLGILCEDGTEIQYPQFENFRMPQVEGCFMVEVTPDMISTGEVNLPRSFAKRFKHTIPKDIHYSLTNGEQMEGLYVKKEKKFKGLEELFSENMAYYGEGLLFTYCGFGIFEIAIFNDSNVEKLYPIVEEEPVVGSEESNDILEDNGPMLEQIFSWVMTRSNVNNSSHGVYIPRFVRLQNRGWAAIKWVILTTDEGAWDVGLVMANGRPRFSSGWNQFVREAGVNLGDTLLFRMFEEEESVVFNIEVHSLG